MEGFRRRLIEAAPRFIAFNGKRAAAAFLGGGRETCQSDLCAAPQAPFMLPSTSGAASGHWSIAPWADLAERVERSGRVI